MSNYQIEFDPRAQKDMDALNSSQRKPVYSAIKRISRNPLPKNEGGYGNPLGHKYGMNLTGLCSIKLHKLGIRVVYKVIRVGNIMKIIVVAARADEKVYRIAHRRIN